MNPRSVGNMRSSMSRFQRGLVGISIGMRCFRRFCTSFAGIVYAGILLALYSVQGSCVPSREIGKSVGVLGAWTGPRPK